MRSLKALQEIDSSESDTSYVGKGPVAAQVEYPFIDLPQQRKVPVYPSKVSWISTRDIEPPTDMGSHFSTSSWTFQSEQGLCHLDYFLWACSISKVAFCSQ
jgi:hypothetical protein